MRLQNITENGPEFSVHLKTVRVESYIACAVNNEEMETRVSEPVEYGFFIKHVLYCASITVSSNELSFFVRICAWIEVTFVQSLEPPDMNHELMFVEDFEIALETFQVRRPHNVYDRGFDPVLPKVKKLL